MHNEQGKAVETDDILAKKTVLVVYRGGWCPYCNSQLSDLQDIENQILQLGYQIIAVSPDAPSFIKQTEDAIVKFLAELDEKINKLMKVKNV